MPKARLARGDYTDAMFDYVVLRGADMHDSVFANANFIRSDLGEVDVTNADFSEALIDRYQRLSMCESASGTNPYTGVDTRDSLQCDTTKPYDGFNKGNKVAVVDPLGKDGPRR